MTKEGRVQSIQGAKEGTTDYTNKKYCNYYKKQSMNSKKIVVDAYKDNKEITINATKYDDNVGGKYIDKKR